MFKRLSAIMLALFVLVASTGYSITAHLCHGKAVSYSLFGSPAGCGTGEEILAENDHCEHPAMPVEAAIQKHKCCEDLSQYFKGIDQVARADQQPLAFPALLVSAFVELKALIAQPFASAVKPPLADYRPAPGRATFPFCYGFSGFKVYVCVWLSPEDVYKFWRNRLFRFSRHKPSRFLKPGRFQETQPNIPQ